MINIKKEDIEKSNSWPFVEAKKILKERKKYIDKKGKIILQTGYGPSGLPHIGTFGEVARTSMVVNALNYLTDLPKEIIPDTESLKDTYERVAKFYEDVLKNDLKSKNILISAHGNSIRALCKFLFKLDNKQISKLEIPTGNPLVLEIDNQYNIQNCKYLDQDRAKDLVVF